ncbi:N-6 DNA methylase [Pseudanabaena sp. 'Roaring Creek']|uniref:N-6 DNA methylase n=1 Tax=Pseudanabaena sp. 'Roaring Creek' TaxID=1681830 RepID=UPI0006D84DC8|nr:N-6 DNA methylase [Pseudanabaena sp. 'Roaring Creek']
MNLSDILKDSEYKLSQFKPNEVAWLEQTIFLKSSTKGDVPYVKCLVRGKDIKLTPEEAVRQLYLKVLCDRYHYPVNRILVEYEVSFGREKKRADIAIMDKDRPNVPYIIVELKKPKLKDGKDQLRSYCNATGSPIGVWTNGEQISFYQRKDPNYFEDITDIPNVNQTLADILNERFTLVDLIKKDKLVTEKKSLKALIKEMEDEVLANAGVDVFEELFMLIFTKLYDEWESGRDEKRKKTRLLEFRNTGQTETELKTKIQGLFDRAKKKWEGVFKESDKITLSLAHLSVCVASLENVKLFNSNLDVVDEAFEYLISKSSKGEKGQYFTPRYVIDMCVKMLNPQEDEAIIDTAAGSSGFPVHTIFHVWQQIIDDEGLQVSNLFSLEKKPARCEDYVKNRVFAIDFDEKAVRVSRTLNLIAGDGQTNVLHLNTLDYESWKERAKEDDWRDVYGDGFKRLRGLADKKDDFKSFQFDIVMANPPFAGEIKESQTISKYDLALKPNGKRQEKMGRDILFIERNLDFLKAGGRMAVVLPQGRFNNSSDKYIRDFIAERCRILAVVGLHGNTFKPHTGTKTSVLFVQKWNDDPKAGALCPRQDDYNIFFATMRKGGKDNSGDKVYVKRSERSPLAPLKKGGGESLEVPLFKGDLGGSEFLLDSHGHLIVDHDLFNHDGLTEDGIAEAFMEFAKKENLSFFDLSSSVTPFDPEKYDRLMDELEAAEVKLSSLEFSGRIDSEYYRPRFLELETKISSKNHCYLEEKSSFLIGPFGSQFLVENYEKSSRYRYVRGKDVKPFFVMDDDNNYIPEKDYIRLSKYKLLKNDILVSVVGTIGNSSIVTDEVLPAMFSCKSTVLRIKDEYFPKYLLTYLNTETGKGFLLRKTRGAIQVGLNLDDLKTLLIYIPSIDFQKFVAHLVDASKYCLDQSKLFYQQAEDLLLSELGLKDWQPTDENIAVKSFSASFGTSDRLDAEYYQPKYDQLYSLLKATSLQKGWELKRLESLSSVFKYGVSDALEYIESGVPFLRIADLQKYRFSESDLKFISHDAAKKYSATVQTGDVLISRSGTLGLAIVIPEYLNNAIYGSYFILTRPDQNLINPKYLAFYLNSLAGKLQTEQANTGGIQTNLTIPVLESLLIMCPPLDIQQRLVDKVNQSYEAQDQSKQLLEIAKTGVEKAIEENEEVAINWINEQLESSQP